MSNMFHRLLHLRNRGFMPKTILDIGANTGEWSDMVKNIFPTSKLFLFEADEINQKILEEKKYDHFITLLGDQINKEVNFYCSPAAKYQTGNSIFKENTRHYVGDNLEIKTKKMDTVDNIANINNIQDVDFIKLDVQGAELLVLEGSKETLKTTQVVLLEAPVLQYNEGAPSFAEYIDYMNKIDFILYDIVELHYLPNKLFSQVDLLFMKSNLELFPKGILC